VTEQETRANRPARFSLRRDRYASPHYGNASKLVGYATQPDGSLKEIISVKIPYNSPEGLAGF